MRKNFLCAFVAALLGALGPLVCAMAAPPEEPLYSLVAQKIAALKSVLSEEPVIAAVRHSNTLAGSLTREEIEARDREWQASNEITDFIKSLLSNDCAKRLMDLQEADDSLVEIFITNEKGLNVCQTNRTSDYLQADEKWWQDAFASGRGLEFYGPIEFDESAGVDSMSAYVPVMVEGRAIGVAKAVIDTGSLKHSLGKGD